MSDQHNESFRDTIATIDDSGVRNFIHPKKPKGKFYNYRTWLSWILLLIFFVSPFLKVNGNQFFLFNVGERQFNIFGYPFFPQDFHLFAIAIGIMVVFIILFTVIFGRIFCGWLCPQTIFMEMVFRKVEYAIEGDRAKQIKLDKQEWNAEKIRKKGLKWFIFFIISFIISNTFLAYVMGSDELIQHMKAGIGPHLKTFIILLVFTGVFYFVFAWFREQACIIVCPYGRLQGVLLDNKSINVAYDFIRGEGEKGRGKYRKSEDRAAMGNGDCVDCKQCVAVCPTGIDIRNGTQLECINCTACIDACDAMMDSVGFEKGLIRYASEDNIEKGEKFKFNARLGFYTFILTALTVLLVSLIIFRGSVETVILRLPGQMYTTDGEKVTNVYTYKIINKGTKTLKDMTFKILSHKGDIKYIGGEHFDVKEQERAEGTLFLNIDKSELHSRKEKIKIGVYEGDKLIEEVSTNFPGPMVIK
jgi:cytochrome c oxidase accessory protein FixG